MTKEQYIEQFGDDAFKSIQFLTDIPKIDKSLVEVIRKQSLLEVLTSPINGVSVEIENTKNNCILKLYNVGEDPENGIQISYSPAVGLESYDLICLLQMCIKNAL